MKWTKPLTVMAVVSAVLVAGCSAGKDNVASTDGGCDGTGTLKIGLIGGITGGVVAITERGLNSAKLAVEQANADKSVKIACRPYELTTTEADDKYDVAEAATAMRRLVQVEKVDVIVGSYTSLVALAQMDVAEQLKTPFIITGATTSQIPKKIREKKYKYVFMSSPTAPERARADATAVNDLLSPKKAFTVYQDTDWGRDVSATFAEVVKAANPGAVTEDEVVDPGTTNYGPVISQIKNQDPDVVYAAIGGVEFFSFIEQMRSAKLDTQIFGSSSDAASTVFIKEMGEKANGVMGNLVWVPNDKSELIKRFSSEYDAKYGSLPADVEAQTYDGMLMLFDALNKAKSSGRQDIAEALLTAKVEGVRGPNSYSPEDHTTKGLNFIIGQIQNGKHVLLWPEEAKTGELLN
jgi:branched-chain amino acid transport system substrate-binding protein